jgi:glycosyltransferase involved in cell wall biosynthesis
VDIAKFEAVVPLPLADLGLDAERRMILFIGRLEHDKRPHWLLERMPEIARRLPQHDLVVVGQGPLASDLRRAATRLGVADRVHFVGWRPDVPRLLAAADLLVLTSTSEGMSNAILEAMASARPVVATDVHGALELLGDDHGGQLVATNAPAAFVDAVAGVAGDADLVHQLGERNRDRIRREYSFERTVASYATLYNELLRAKNR